MGYESSKLSAGKSGFELSIEGYCWCCEGVEIPMFPDPSIITGPVGSAVNREAVGDHHAGGLVSHE